LQGVSFSNRGTPLPIINCDHNIASSTVVQMFSDSTGIDTTKAQEAAKLLIPVAGKFDYSGADISSVLYTAQQNATYALELTNNSTDATEVLVEWGWVEFDYKEV